MEKRQTLQVFSWIISGSLIGLGLLSFDVFFVSIPCLIVGLSLLTFMIIRSGTGHLWIALLCLGIIPTLFLLNDIISSYPFCSLQENTIPASSPAGTNVSCGFVPATYYILLACFGAIALVSGAWPILRQLTHHSAT